MDNERFHVIGDIYVVPTEETRAELAEVGITDREAQDGFYRNLADAARKLEITKERSRRGEEEAEARFLAGDRSRSLLPRDNS